MTMDRCPECIDGQGWVVISPTGQSTVRPCSRCRTSTWDRWTQGAYRPSLPPPPTAEERTNVDELRRLAEQLAEEKAL